VPKILVVGGGYAGFYTAWKNHQGIRLNVINVTTS
jgi:NADH dehydrogenase FAD-containing subunit